MKTKIKFAWVLILVAIPLCFAVGRAPLERWDYATSDDIARCAIDTEIILHRYESTNDPKEISQWILHGPTEALSTQMCMTLSGWATTHEGKFVAVMAGLPSKERGEFIEKFCVSLSQSHPKEFEVTFANNKSASLREIMKILSETRPVA